MSQVELSVKTQLNQLIAELAKVQGGLDEVSKKFEQTGKNTGEQLKNHAKKTSQSLETMGSYARRVFDRIKSDLKSMASIQGFAGGLAIQNQFKGTLTETIKLNDTIRKLGTTFGFSKGEFSKFQSAVQKGLGDIGLSSEVASDALKGLADTPVRGQDNVIAYAKEAGMIASLSGQQGQEGEIAKGIAGVLRAQGKNVNDIGEMQKVAKDLLAVYNATGAAPQQTIQSMESIFASMPQDMRKKVTTRGLGQLAAVAQSAGPNATKFIEDYMKMGKTQRMALDAQGMGKIFKQDGSLDTKAFQSFAKNIQGRVGNDPRLAAQTLGISEDAAEGMVRLVESMERLDEIQTKVAGSTAEVSDQYKNSMGLGEAFKANINQLKGMISEPLATATQGVTDVLSDASQSKAGAAAVVGGGALLSAVLLGGGLRGIGKGLLGGLAKEQAMESLTGEEVQKVYVINASEIGGGGLGAAAQGAGLLSKAGTALKFAGGVGLAAGAGIAVGTGLNAIDQKYGQFTTGEGTEDQFTGTAFQQLLNKLDMVTNGLLSGVERVPRVEITTKVRDIKASPKGSRGGSF